MRWNTGAPFYAGEVMSRTDSAQSRVRLPENVMSRILFSPESFNMGETTRCIEIARAAQERGHTVLFHVYSPKYLGLLENAGLPVHLREPIMSDAEAEQIMALDQGRECGTLLRPAWCVEGLPLSLRLSVTLARMLW